MRVEDRRRHRFGRDQRVEFAREPKESIDLQGFTGPFVQYTYARIKSILRKGEISETSHLQFSDGVQLNALELELINKLYHFRIIVDQSVNELDPSLLTLYVYQLSKLYNQFYHEHPILKEENADLKNFRLRLSVRVAEMVKLSLGLLGIGVSEKM